MLSLHISKRLWVIVWKSTGKLCLNWYEVINVTTTFSTNIFMLQFRYFDLKYHYNAGCGSNIYLFNMYMYCPEYTCIWVTTGNYDFVSCDGDFRCLSPMWKYQFFSTNMHSVLLPFFTLRPRQTGCLFLTDIFKCILVNGNVRIPINISLNFLPQGPIYCKSALVQINAWWREVDKPLS